MGNDTTCSSSQLHFHVLRRPGNRLGRRRSMSLRQLLQASHPLGKRHRSPHTTMSSRLQSIMHHSQHSGRRSIVRAMIHLVAIRQTHQRLDVRDMRMCAQRIAKKEDPLQLLPTDHCSDLLIPSKRTTLRLSYRLQTNARQHLTRRPCTRQPKVLQKRLVHKSELLHHSLHVVVRHKRQKRHRTVHLTVHILRLVHQFAAKIRHLRAVP
mmetsp:Transcript_29335/g.64464  ORF Transcript_29335/g.64464 Transcript_29335/m.64464 type:complete len:209 (-) Transcript_29335:164-790(-)